MNRRIHFGSAFGTSIFLRLIVIGFPPKPTGGTDHERTANEIGRATMRHSAR